MRKVLLTTMFGALFATSSLSAKAQAGSVSGNVAVSVGAVFFSGVKSEGLTAVGGLKVTDAVAADAHDAGASVLKTKADISAKTDDIKKKAGAVVELTTGGSYWFTDNFGMGLDLGFGAMNGKLEDDTTGNRSKVSTTFSIMPTATFYMTENLVLNVGAGIAWTKVKDLALALKDDVKVETASTNVATAADKSTFDTTVKTLLDDAQAGKFLKDITADNKQEAKDEATLEYKLKKFASDLNTHNASVVSAAQKSFKTKPCFTAKVSVGYVLGENSQVSLGYQYTGIKSKAKNASENKLKAHMHSIVATYSYHF